MENVIHEYHQALQTCTFCGRKFTQKRIEKHAAICEKVYDKKRSPFNIQNKRALQQEYSDLD